MKVTVAIDSFKGSLSTFDSGKAVLEGIKRVYEDADVVISPLADGGEGTVDAIISATSGRLVKAKVHGPLGDIIESTFGIIEERKTAVIEMSAAAGITLVSSNQRNPLNTTTYGVGELIKCALDMGCRRFIIGIGGSATNDGGLGMLQALGFKFFDKFGEEVEIYGRGLQNISKINLDKSDKRLSESTFLVACDVTNPLCGTNGASAIYGPQKGATAEIVEKMDLWLNNFADLTKSVIPHSDKDAKGAGAAGGLGFALMSFLNAELRSGVELVIIETNLEKHIVDSDIVVTGEGRLDAQSSMGKAPVGVAKLAKIHSKPVIAFSGAVKEDARLCNNAGIDAYFPILRKPSSLEDAMNIENAYSNLRDTAEQVFRLINTFK